MVYSAGCHLQQLQLALGLQTRHQRLIPSVAQGFRCQNCIPHGCRSHHETQFPVVFWHVEVLDPILCAFGGRWKVSSPPVGWRSQVDADAEAVDQNGQISFYLKLSLMGWMEGAVRSVVVYLTVHQPMTNEELEGSYHQRPAAWWHVFPMSWAACLDSFVSSYLLMSFYP